MIDHLSTYATNFERTRDFYNAVFTPLGYGKLMEFSSSEDADMPGRRICAFGPEDNPAFWVIEVSEAYTPRHTAFCAESREAVEAFHRAGLDAGGSDHGGPGLRPEYHPHYYGAFLTDPDGNNVEAVYHRPLD